MSSQSKKKFWSASAWKTRLKRENSSESGTTGPADFRSAHSSFATNQTDTTEVLPEEQAEVLTRYSSSVYSKDEDVCSVVLPPSDDKKEDLDEYYLVSLPCLPFSLASHIPNRQPKMILGCLTDKK
jgi:hypothetical protein